MNQTSNYGKPRIYGHGKKLSRLRYRSQPYWIHCDSKGKIQEKGQTKIYNIRSQRRDAGIKKKDSTLDIASENELAQQETIIGNPIKNTEETMISESADPKISMIEEQNSKTIRTENYHDSFEVEMPAPNMDTQYNYDENNRDSSWLNDAIDSNESFYHLYEPEDSTFIW